MTEATKKRSRKKAAKKTLFSGATWNEQLLERGYDEIERINNEKYQLDVYPNQIEIITSEQMLDAYSSVAMPVMYNHWSFGKQFVHESEAYKRGQMGLAYEVVINSDPCIAYLMEENTMMMQLLVMAHASFGHNSFFKGNYLFQQWTDASTIIDYLVFAKRYIAKCEERYGPRAVEEVLDSCHALKLYGVDRYKRPAPLTLAEERARQQEREEYARKHYNDLWRTIPKQDVIENDDDETNIFPPEPEENLLYFVEKNAPHLDTWKRELIRIVRKVAQYFYPQMQTQVMNEGWATFWHYTFMNDLWEQNIIPEGYMLEFLQSHSNVVMQLPFNHKYFNGLNPYALGFAMFRDIKRICVEPTEEDKEWFPDFAGNGDWLSTIKWAMHNFKDESFIQQFLSPKVMRDMKLFTVIDDDRDNELEISAIHNKNGFKHVRRVLANQYNLNQNLPNIQVKKVNIRSDRSLLLRHYMSDRRPLERDMVVDTLKHLRRLWEFDVKLESVDEKGAKKARYRITEKEELVDIFDK